MKTFLKFCKKDKENNSNEKENDCKICLLPTYLNKSWHSHLSEEFKKDYFSKIFETLHNKSFFPPVEKIFSFTNYFSLEETKIVIIGQDPYHNVNQATGLAFSVNKTEKTPPSLKNIYKELKSNFPTYKIPSNGCLKHWVQQKILLLNSTLTVEKNKPNSHSKIGWQTFTDKIIEVLSQKGNKIFVLWGNYAISKKNIIDSENNTILESSHPSPFSARRGFFGCEHFKKINEILDKKGEKKIDW